MPTIRLGQLFACTEKGGSLVAEALDGGLMHIDDVPSGLACNCICPGCRGRMVAKKGKVKTHHFSHHAQQEGRPCLSAGETALHKFAKQLLNERLEIALPAMEVAEKEDREIVVRAAKLKFEAAVLEKKDGQIVPDVVLLLRERRLIVEFMVTHPCDENKIGRIRSMDVGAIEIDLSQYRDLLLSEIGGCILYDAPRSWLHNPREREAKERLARRAQQRATEKDKQVEHFRSVYSHRLPSKMDGTGQHEVRARHDGLGDIINVKVDGAGCFTAALAEWQAAVLQSLIAATNPPFRTRTGVDVIRKKGWLNRKFAKVSDEIAKAVRECGVPFNSPTKTVEAYLLHLQAKGFVQAGPTETWRPTALLRSRIEEIRERRDRPAKRMAEVRELVEGMLKCLPPEDTENFLFETWWNSKAGRQNSSPREAADSEVQQWQSFLHDIRNLTTKIRYSLQQGLDLIGLPFEGELMREVERKRLEAAARELAEKEKAEANKNIRMMRLRKRALEQMGADGEIWLTMESPRTGGRAPIDVAADSDAGYMEADQALDRRIREIKAEVRAAERKSKAVSELTSLAQSKYFDSDRAALWMRSKRPELGGKSPEEFTVDTSTRERCEELLPAKRSRR